MLSSMAHEAWYRSGIHMGGEFGFHIGWVTHGGEFADCLPILNESHDMTLFLAGEVFHDPDVIQGLRNRGHDFVNGNASYLIHLYEEKGDGFFNELNGWFSGVLLDNRQNKVFLFNDRYGMHRIFIHESKEGLYFASEAKALLSVIPKTRDFDLKGLAEFLTCGCTLGDHSLYKGISVLPSGSSWTFVKGEVLKKDSYFKPGNWDREGLLGEKQGIGQIVGLFGEIVNRYSRSAFPIGISLTGGLDSRMALACINGERNDFTCYTFGSLYRDTFDVQVARQVAKACSRPHHVLVLGEEFLQELPKYLERAVYISDGYIGLSGCAELYLNSLARKIAPIRLTGNYGGELLRGDRSFKSEVPRGRFVTPDFEPFLVEAQNTFQDLESTDALTLALFRQAPSQGYGRLAIERSQLNLRTPFMDNDLVRMVYGAPKKLLEGNALSAAIISRYNPFLLKIPTDRGLLGICNGLGIVGIFRRAYREILFKAEYWSNNGIPVWLGTISHKGFEKRFQKYFLGRHKFQHFGIWTQENIANYVIETLLEGSREFQGIFSSRQVENMVHDHLARGQNFTNEIDKLLNVILTHRLLVEGREFKTKKK